MVASQQESPGYKPLAGAGVLLCQVWMFTGCSGLHPHKHVNKFANELKCRNNILETMDLTKNILLGLKSDFFEQALL